MKTTDVTLADFEPWELEAFADGQPLPHVAAFVATHAAEWAAWLAREGQPLTLTAALFRFDCPRVDELRDYLWQQLSAQHMGQLADHLQVCPHCSDELTTLRELLAQEAAHLPVANPASTAEVPPFLRDLPQRLQRWWQQAQADLAIAVAQLVPMAPAPALGALRSEPGRTANTLLLYETASVDISLLIEQAPPYVCRIGGQLYTTTVEPTGTVRWWGATEALGSGACAISATGTFAIESIQPGDYHLVVQLPTQQVVIPRLSVT